MRYYVIADMHGFLTLTKAALDRAGYFSDPDPHKLVILGDSFDRGKEAVAMQSFICSLLDKDAVILIRGNHEDLFCELATDDHGLAYSHHVSNGTYDTALQLTGYDMAMAPIRHYDFAEAMQRTPYFQRIIPASRDYYETEHYIFVHGWIPCFAEKGGWYSSIDSWRDADDILWEKARWCNGMAAAAQGVTEEGKTILCGHWHASYAHSRFEHKGPEFGPGAVFTPYYGKGIIALDAATGVSGIVNCVVVED